jgi:hydroxymethylbilane synthase
MRVIGTRASDLALTQSRWVAERLQELGVQVCLERIRTQGDKVQHLSLDKLEGKGFFTKEIEQALLDRKVDIAVHSLKDLPSELVPGLVVAAMPTREDERDCLVMHPEVYSPGEAALPIAQGMRIGTSAIRRKAQLFALRPDLQAADVRGNVPTRLRRLASGDYAAVLLAAAGLRRLQLELPQFKVVPLDAGTFVPAPGQGALALQCRADDAEMRAILSRLHDARDAARVACERGLLGLLHAGCHVPLGAHATYAAGDAMDLSVFFGQAAYADPGAPPPHRFVVQGADAESAARLAFARLTGADATL